ncbi:MAG: hypothetical protein QXP61_10470 [Nitrososphaerales archaeon]
MERIYFVLCPRCYWHASYLKKKALSCPVCNSAVTRHRLRIYREYHESDGKGGGKETEKEMITLFMH